MPMNEIQERLTSVENAVKELLNMTTVMAERLVKLEQHHAELDKHVHGDHYFPKGAYTSSFAGTRQDPQA